MEVSGEDGVRPIALSNTESKVFDGGPPIDHFSAFQQEEGHIKPPPPAEVKSSHYNDKTEPVFAFGKKLTSFMTMLKEGIPATARVEATLPPTVGASYASLHSPSRKSSSL